MTRPGPEAYTIGQAALIVASAALLIRAAVALEPAELPAETASFIADGVVQIGDERLDFKVFHDAGRERHEMAIDDLFQITIFRPDLGTAYLVQPEADTYIPLPLEDISLWPRYRMQAGYSIERQAREEEGGETTTRFRIRGSEAAPIEMDVLVWITDDGIEMRLEGEMEVEGILENVVLMRRNVRRQPVDPDLFDPTEALLALTPPGEIQEGNGRLKSAGP